MRATSQALILMLMIDAAWVAYGLLHHWDMWPWICGYWIILTAKNAVDWIGGKRHGNS